MHTTLEITLHGTMPKLLHLGQTICITRCSIKNQRPKRMPVGKYPPPPPPPSLSSRLPCLCFVVVVVCSNQFILYFLSIISLYFCKYFGMICYCQHIIMLLHIIFIACKSILCNLCLNKGLLSYCFVLLRFVASPPPPPPICLRVLFVYMHVIFIVYIKA